jgi:hypothetical protein
VLGVACVALAVSNVVLALRLTAVRARATAEAPAPAADRRPPAGRSISLV